MANAPETSPEPCRPGEAPRSFTPPLFPSRYEEELGRQEGARGFRTERERGAGNLQGTWTGDLNGRAETEDGWVEAELLEQVKFFLLIDETNIDCISLGPKDYARS